MFSNNWAAHILTHHGAGILPVMKSLILLMAVVLVGGCRTTSVSFPEHGPDGRNLRIERAIRDYLGWLGHPKPTGELTKTDYKKVVGLSFFTYQLTDLKGLEKCTQLKN
tara:strand:- start:253 stop:579 length:327 start_codon:yes stop_codon:yes gene_type:complete